jgi:hypothetical protein
MTPFKAKRTLTRSLPAGVPAGRSDRLGQSDCGAACRPTAAAFMAPKSEFVEFLRDPTCWPRALIGTTATRSQTPH